ncbi:hypothetical protein FRX31_011795 [Thalictrum thalictroides]|uniref:Uncharacterized protein n=1 Tax=Thalictrum thalictroides TaxID=46969 RepID=A0A7J6WMM7_THATH|nr:hypothetical protein FRX31_011795 [Thalictrum thalictroides]
MRCGTILVKGEVQKVQHRRLKNGLASCINIRWRHTKETKTILRNARLFQFKTMMLIFTLNHSGKRDLTLVGTALISSPPSSAFSSSEGLLDLSYQMKVGSTKEG